MLRTSHRPPFALASLMFGTALLLVPGIAKGQDFEARGFKLVETQPLVGSQEDVAAGRELYDEHCAQCHGGEGDGQGVMAELLDPRPRDFRRGVFKIRTTMQGELPTDGDVFRIIGNGMPGTSMPAWRDILSEAQIWQLVHYVKTFSLDFEDYPAEQEFVLEGKPEATPESVARGAEVYEQAECAKCHGVAGRGNGPSAPTLEDEWEQRIYPADLTQPWALRGGHAVEDFYRTLTTGINGTPMPSFSDAWKSEDLWHLSNYLESIGRRPSYGEILRGIKTDGVPHDPFDDAWELAPEIDIRLAGQIIEEPRRFNPAIRSLSVRVLFDEQEIALLFTWNDRFENKGQQETPVDRVAVLFPAREMAAGKKPYFLMGDRRNPVDSWQWLADQRIETVVARGLKDVRPRASAVEGAGVFRDGQYRVVLRRTLLASQEDEVNFVPGRMIPIAWNVWNGETGEVGKRRAISRWYYLLLEPETPWTTWLWPICVVVLVAGAEVVGLRRLRQHWEAEPDPPEMSEVATS
jgi:DMSO reductase family type II enzyme heme b subunit